MEPSTACTYCSVITNTSDVTQPKALVALQRFRNERLYGVAKMADLDIRWYGVALEDYLHTP